jgi:hypothetical protein
MVDYERLKRVIESREISPTIINPESKFVVVTYWWGRDNFNRNTARPCPDFYEAILNKSFKILLQELTLDDIQAEIEKINKDMASIVLQMRRTRNKKVIAALERRLSEMKDKRTYKRDEYSAITDRHLPEKVASFRSQEDILSWVNSIPELVQFYDKKARDYTIERLVHSGTVYNKADPDPTHTELIESYKNIIKSFVVQMLYKYLFLARYTYEINEEADKEPLAELLKDITCSDRNEIIQMAVKRAISIFIKDPMEKPEGGLIYVLPITYDVMIRDWEDKCRRSGCNFMYVEYPEFVGSKGYQMAINAKPLFIQKALRSCGGRAVVYIDGDMTINRYPYIFDMDDVDFMARGWNIDSRANEDYIDNPIVDPYVFETSGGIMYFSDSIESHKLLEAWIAESAKPGQRGRADDRILSLVFSVRKLLAPMKIIQLPIEYLWLTLSYDNYLDEDYMSPDRIYVEHPQCLTSEDTAASGGASSNRSAKFTGAIPPAYPRTEHLYEFAMFPTSGMADEFRPWLHYTSHVKYTKDVVNYDEDYTEELSALVDSKLLYIVPFHGGFGALNPVYENNIRLAERDIDYVNTRRLNTRRSRSETTVVVKLNIPSILNSLRNGIDVMYVPTSVDMAELKKIRNIVEKHERLEFVFSDTAADFELHTMYNYTIDLTKPIFMRHGNPLLIMLLALSNSEPGVNNNAAPKGIPFEYILKNNYHFLSRIRVHVMRPPLKFTPSPVQEGGSRGRGMRGGGGIDRSTDDALNMLYPLPTLPIKTHKQHSSKRRTTRKRTTRKRTTRKRTTIRKSK